MCRWHGSEHTEGRKEVEEDVWWENPFQIAGCLLNQHRRYRKGTSVNVTNNNVSVSTWSFTVSWNEKEIATVCHRGTAGGTFWIQCNKTNENKERKRWNKVLVEKESGSPQRPSWDSNEAVSSISALGKNNYCKGCSHFLSQSLTQCFFLFLYDHYHRSNALKTITLQILLMASVNPGNAPPCENESNFQL